MDHSLNSNENALAIAMQQPEQSKKLIRIAEVCYELFLFKNHLNNNPDCSG